MIQGNEVWYKRVLLNPPITNLLNTDQPTTDHLPIEPLTHQPPTHLPNKHIQNTWQKKYIQLAELKHSWENVKFFFRVLIIKFSV